MKYKHLVFAVIAMREVDFFISIAKILSKKGFEISFISFFQPGNKKIRSNKFACYDIYDFKNNSEKLDNFEDYDIYDVKKVLLHEKLTFGIKSDTQLKSKLKHYLLVMDIILEKLISKNRNKDLIIFQELGGFIAPLSLYYCSIRKNIDHVFFEPSFFKSRVYFQKNSLKSDKREKKNVEKLLSVKKYLDNFKKNSSAIIPEKDILHFQDTTFLKFFNNINLQKFTKKIIYKYILFEKQEYDKIFNHVIRNFKMVLNRKLIGKYYSSLKVLNGKKYFFFPFHVPLDFALTIRSPEYLNQLGTIEKIHSIIPSNMFLVVKEHPAATGSYNGENIKKLLKNNKRLILLDSQQDSSIVVKNSSAVITINSKVGAEAIANKIPVFSLGDAFYSDWSSVIFSRSIERLKEEIDTFMIKNKIIEEETVLQEFNSVWNNTFNGELYTKSINGINTFSKSLLSFLTNNNNKNI